MVDTFSKETRSYVMSRIKCKDTKPEIIVRSYLFSRGLRFRKNDKRYPGSPDIVLPKYKTIVFVHDVFGISMRDASMREFQNQMLITGKRNFTETENVTNIIRKN